MLEIGTKAPAFKLPDQNGEMHTLEEYKGKKVILYFYPRDNTPGCTKQACGFGELYPQFTEKGAVVLGVSKDLSLIHIFTGNTFWDPRLLRQAVWCSAEQGKPQRKK